MGALLIDISLRNGSWADKYIWPKETASIAIVTPGSRNKGANIIIEPKLTNIVTDASISRQIPNARESSMLRMSAVALIIILDVGVVSSHLYKRYRCH